MTPAPVLVTDGPYLNEHGAHGYLCTQTPGRYTRVLELLPGEWEAAG